MWVFVDGSLVILSSPPRLSNGVAKVWGTGYLLMVMGGPRRGKKRWHFSPDSKIAHEKSTICSSSGFFHVKKRPEASWFCSHPLSVFFLCVPRFSWQKYTKILKGAGIFVPFSHYSTCYKRQPPSHNVATEAAPGKGGVPDWVLRTWRKKFGLEKKWLESFLV